ncbi:helix-turn-helix domain-containing protein, partial [Levilactobacillus parabrevis]|uniref:helix-turn-helix domain-containing protein n=1 Tax=Levilactobacillus parabrevis TaxID=357278 RepID=UPI0012DF6D1B
METYTFKRPNQKERGISMTQSNHTTTITYQQLSAEERGQIEAFLKDHQSVRQIARNLHRNPSTISR